MTYILAIAFAVAGLLFGDVGWVVAAVVLYYLSRIRDRMEDRDDDGGF